MNLPAKQQFDSHAQDNFDITFTEGEALSCQIEEIKAGLKPPSDTHKEQFSVVFSCAEPTVFNQGVYKISHHELGTFELFLVPVFGDDKGVHYEAVFS